MILSIESSVSDQLSVSLKNGNGIYTEKISCDKNGSEKLLPLVDSVLNKTGTSIDNIKKIFVDVGPGSFTGIRIGINTANGLAFGKNIDVIGILSLDTIGLSYKSDKYLCSVIKAGRGEIYNRVYNNFLPVTEPVSVKKTDVINYSEKYHDIEFIGESGCLDNIAIKQIYPDSEKLVLIGEKYNDLILPASPIYLQLSQAEEEYNKRSLKND